MSFVFDISDETVFVVSGVRHDLGSAVGKSNSVFAGYVSVVILSLRLVEAGTRVVILDSILVSERLRGEFFRFVPMRCRFVGGGFVGWGRGIGPGGGDGEESGKDGGLELII